MNDSTTSNDTAQSRSLSPRTVTDSLGRFSTFVTIPPRAVPLGGPRAMTVHRTLPAKQTSLIGAWCFVDHFGPDDITRTGGMNVPRHPHTGLATVSWLFEGAITHRDSLGYHALVNPGDLDLMVAGYGITHSEFSTRDTTILHGVQLWFALPDRTRHRLGEFRMHTARELTAAGARMRVGLGEGALRAGDERVHDQSPILTDTPLFLAQVDLEAGASARLELNPSHEYGVIVDSGPVHLRTDVKEWAGEHAGEQETTGNNRDLVALPGEIDSVDLTAGENPARVLVIGGEPLGEDIVMWWNFIGRTHDEIEAFRARYQHEIGASHSDGAPALEARTAQALEEANLIATVDTQASTIEFPQFGVFAPHTPEALPAPDLPHARMRTRGRVHPSG